MQWLDRLSAKKGIVGIEITTHGLVVAARACLNKNDAIDLINVIQPHSSSVSLQTELSEFVAKHKIAKRLCNLVLASKDYQLLLVEAPDVPEESICDAIRWKIKDLISMPIDKAIIDVFHVPKDANKSAKKMVYAVVADRDRILELIALVNDSGLILYSIDISEMALRNISMVLAAEQQERGVGIVRLQVGGGVMSLYREGNLYLSRQFKLNYNAGLLDDLPVDALGLEVQRSLDYYDRQMGLPPPAVLYFCGENVSADKITLDLTRSISVPARHMDLHEKVKFQEEVDDGMIQLCLGALGSVYRGVGLQ